MSNIIKHEQLPLADINTIAKTFAESGLFADAKSAAQAMVKIYAGQEIGIPPFSAMSGIHVIQGKPVMGAGIVASRVKGSGKYDYKVTEHTEKTCAIDFYQFTTDGKSEKIGNSTFTIEDAKKAGTKNLDKFPKNMLFARAISNGVKWYTPDIFAGPVYVPEEMVQVTEDVKPVSVTTGFTVTEDELNELNSLISSSTLDGNAKVIAANSISNAKTAAALSKIKARLLEVQPV